MWQLRVPKLCVPRERETTRRKLSPFSDLGRQAASSPAAVSQEQGPPTGPSSQEGESDATFCWGAYLRNFWHVLLLHRSL